MPHNNNDDDDDDRAITHQQTKLELERMKAFWHKLIIINGHFMTMIVRPSGKLRWGSFWPPFSATVAG